MSEHILTEVIKCWSCGREQTVLERAGNDGDCIFCGTEIDLDQALNAKPNRFVYHYCLVYQERNRSLSFIDGIAQMEKRITCMDDYKMLKEIAAPDELKGKVIMNSLSFIGMEQDG